MHRCWWFATALLTQMALADPGGPVGVLMTDWAEPEGFDHTYRRRVASRTYGWRTEFPGQPCTADHVGEFPFASTMGMLPFAVSFPVQGLEGVYDSIGFYRKSEDGQRYVSVFDPGLSYAVSDVPTELVIPAIDSTSRTQRSLWGIDPRNGTNYFKRLWQIGFPPRGAGPNPRAFPNGIRDLDEISVMAGLTDMHVLYADLTPRLSPAAVKINKLTKTTLLALFGSQRIDVRFGGYAPTPGWMELEEDVAVAMVRDGLERLVITRETTDNNNYANNFMTRGYIEAGLCRAGLTEPVQFQQVRQVGRTPEYNTALLHTVQRHVAALPPGTEVTLIYTTYGLPWPGDDQASGPFAAPHPWAKEVFHENAYNNYLSFKHYARAEYGGRYQLNFNYAQRDGDRRVDNYFAYAMYRAPIGDPDDPARGFMTLRQNIDRAKAEGRREVIAVLSHWYDNNRDTLLALRLLQELPLNSRRDLGHGKHWIDWCEVPGATTPVDCDQEGVTHIQLTEAFDEVADIFAIGYAHRIRGGVERFGVLPAGVEPVADGTVKQHEGGGVRVTRGPLQGAMLLVRPDRHPGKPESFTSARYETFNDPAANLVGAWDDFDPYIAAADVSLAGLKARAAVVSEAVLFGPYRTLFNQPATITLPLQAGQTGADARPYIYNEATRDWDPVFPVPGGRPPRPNGQSISFDVQVLGTFVLAVPR